MDTATVIEEKRPNIFILFVILAVFLSTLGILVYYIRYTTSVAPRASSYNTVNSISISNSYVFASPVRAKAGGDIIRVTVFILDDEGNGAYDKKVTLRSENSSLVIKDLQSLTDETGKATFDVNSQVAGNYILEVTVDNLVLPQATKVLFD